MLFLTVDRVKASVISTCYLNFSNILGGAKCDLSSIVFFFILTLVVMNRLHVQKLVYPTQDNVIRKPKIKYKPILRKSHCILHPLMI